MSLYNIQKTIREVSEWIETESTTLRDRITDIDDIIADPVEVDTAKDFQMCLDKLDKVVKEYEELVNEISLMEETVRVIRKEFPRLKQSVNNGYLEIVAPKKSHEITIINPFGTATWTTSTWTSNAYRIDWDNYWGEDDYQ